MISILRNDTNRVSLMDGSLERMLKTSEGTGDDCLGDFLKMGYWRVGNSGRFGGKILSMRSPPSIIQRIQERIPFSHNSRIRSEIRTKVTHSSVLHHVRSISKDFDTEFESDRERKDYSGNGIQFFLLKYEKKNMKIQKIRDIETRGWGKCDPSD